MKRPACLTCDGTRWATRWCFGAGRLRVFDQPDGQSAPLADCGKLKAHGPHSFVVRCGVCQRQDVEATA
jgi:hypothetical protein